MRRKLLAAFLFGLIITFAFGYTRSWTESTPTDATVANQIDDYNRYLRVDVAERLEDYIGGFNASDSNEGFYHLLLLENAASLSTPAANKYLLYGLLADGKCELVGEDEDGDMIQLSYTGKHMIGSGTAPQAFQYNTTEEDTDGGRESTIRAKGEQSGGEVTTLGYLEFSHDGTSDDQKGQIKLVVNDGDDSDAPSKTGVTVNSGGDVTLGDSSQLTTSAAPTADADVANKKYVDDQITASFPDDDAFGSWTNLDSTSGTLVKNEVYKVGSDGFVLITNNAMDNAEILTDSSNPPTTRRWDAPAAYAPSGMSPVKKDDYWKITAAGTPIIHWLPIGSGTCVKQ